MENNHGRKGCSLQASLVKWGSVTSHYSSETEKHLKHFPHSKRLHSLNSDNCFCRLETKKTHNSLKHFNSHLLHKWPSSFASVSLPFVKNDYSIEHLSIPAVSTVSESNNSFFCLEKKNQSKKTKWKYGTITLARHESTFPDICSGLCQTQKECRKSQKPVFTILVKKKKKKEVILSLAVQKK